MKHTLNLIANISIVLLSLWAIGATDYEKFVVRYNIETPLLYQAGAMIAQVLCIWLIVKLVQKCIQYVINTVAKDFKKD